MKIPDYMLNIITTLKQNGHQAFLVGGSVRDILMGNEPADYDAVTSASVQEIRSLFKKTVPVGERHGTVVVVNNGFTVEVSTFKGCELWESPADLKQDLSLRDFTVNAMAFDEDGSLCDPFGGQEDIRNRIIRAPGNEPEKRFTEDPLRMLRAIRFCSTLGFSLHPDTYKAITKHYALLQKVAPERVREELNRILVSDKPAKGIRLMLKTGLLRQVLPEAVVMAGFDQRNKHHNKDVLEHCLAVVEAVPPRLKVRLAALLHDIGKPSTFSIGENGVGHFYGHHRQGQTMAESILRRLRYDSKTIEDVTVLVGEHMSRYPRMRNTTLKRLVNRVGEHNLEDLFDLQKADIMGSAPPFDFSELAVMQEGINRILNEKPPMSIKDLAVKGNDLIEIGFQPGTEMGRVLKLLLEAVLEDPDQNERAVLLELAAEYLKSPGPAK